MNQDVFCAALRKTWRWCIEKNMHFPISRVTSEGYAAEILALQKLADGNQLGEHFLN